MIEKLPYGSRLSALWRYRGFVLSMVVREFRIRYMGSLLGSIWSVLNPMAMIFIYTIVFSKIMRAKLSGIDDTMAFGIFLCAGLLTWGYFSELLSRCQFIFIEQSNLLKKVRFPRITLPVILFLSSSLNFAIIFAIFVLVLGLMNRFPGWSILGIVPVLIIQQAFALGFGVLLGTLNVFFRDIGHLVGIFLQFWFWLTPIVYPITILPENLQGLILLNPMTRIVMAYQNIVLRNEWPVWSDLKLHMIGAFLSLLLGACIFVHLSGDIVDEL